jgi:hypothetical protein
MEFTRVALESLTTSTMMGNGNTEQWAYTKLGEKPTGDGWRYPPTVDVDWRGAHIGLIWKRRLTPHLTPERLARTEESADH